MCLEIPGYYGPDIGWRIVTGVAAVPALITILAYPWLPESPRWLIQAQRHDEAQAVLERLYHDPALKEDCMRSIEEALAAEGKETEAGWSQVLCPSRVVRRMLLAGLGVAFFQQISGSEAIVYYTPTILENFGITTDSGQNIGAVFVGIAKLVGACLGAVFLDCAGRRIGVLVSCIGVAACLVALAGMQHRLASPVLGLSTLCLFMVFFELGLAPAAFVLGTESYPVAIRAKALGLGMFTTRFLSGIIAVVFPTLVQAISLASCLWVFATFACIGVVWAIFCVPETKGLSLEGVTKLFETPIQLFGSRETCVECRSFGTVGKHADSKGTPLQVPEANFPDELYGA
jgi:MFS family permease